MAKLKTEIDVRQSMRLYNNCDTFFSCTGPLGSISFMDAECQHTPELKSMKQSVGC